MYTVRNIEGAEYWSHKKPVSVWQRVRAFRFNLYLAALTAGYVGWTFTWLVCTRGIMH